MEPGAFAMSTPVPKALLLSSCWRRSTKKSRSTRTRITVYRNTTCHHRSVWSGMWVRNCNCALPKPPRVWTNASMTWTSMCTATRVTERPLSNRARSVRMCTFNWPCNWLTTSCTDVWWPPTKVRPLDDFCT